MANSTAEILPRTKSGSEVVSKDEQLLCEQFERWLKNTLEPFDDWEYNGAEFIVYKSGVEPEIYEPALVRALTA